MELKQKVGKERGKNHLKGEENMKMNKHFWIYIKKSQDLQGMMMMINE